MSAEVIPFPGDVASLRRELAEARRELTLAKRRLGQTELHILDAHTHAMSGTVPAHEALESLMDWALVSRLSRETRAVTTHRLLGLVREAVTAPRELGQVVEEVCPSAADEMHVRLALQAVLSVRSKGALTRWANDPDRTLADVHALIASAEADMRRAATREGAVFDAQGRYLA